MAEASRCARCSPDIIHRIACHPHPCNRQQRLPTYYSSVSLGCGRIETTGSLLNLFLCRLARLATVNTGTFPGLTRAIPSICTTVTNRLVGTRNGLGLIFPRLQTCKSACFVVNISNLLVALYVKGSKSLTGWGI